jgi:hypothetical protein
MAGLMAIFAIAAELFPLISLTTVIACGGECSNQKSKTKKGTPLGRPPLKTNFADRIRQVPRLTEVRSEVMTVVGDDRQDHPLRAGQEWSLARREVVHNEVVAFINWIHLEHAS